MSPRIKPAGVVVPTQAFPREVDEGGLLLLELGEGFDFAGFVAGGGGGVASGWFEGVGGEGGTLPGDDFVFEGFDEAGVDRLGDAEEGLAV